MGLSQKRTIIAEGNEFMKAETGSEPVLTMGVGAKSLLKMGIGTKLILAAVAGVIVVVTAVSLVAYHIARNGLREQILSHLEFVARSRAAHVETFLDKCKEMVEVGATSVILADGLATLARHPGDTSVVRKLNVRLKRFVDPRMDVYEVFLLNDAGKVVASSVPRHIGLDRSRDAYFLGAKQGPFIKDAYHSAITERDSLAVSAPILGRAGKRFIGVLVARFGMKGLNAATTDRTGLGKTGETYLINKHGFMITPARFRKDTFLKQRVDTDNSRACLADIAGMSSNRLSEKHEHMAGVFSDYRGVRVLGVHAHVPEMDWGLLAETDASEAFAPITKLRTALLASGAAAAALAMAAAWIFGRRTSRPIRDLHTGARRIGEGDLSHRLDIRTGDEIEQLALELNRMAIRLSRSRASLEQQVADRTRDLAGEKERLSVTISSIGDGVIAVDPEGRVTLINGVAQALTGCTAEVAIGRPLSEVFSIVNEETRRPAPDPVAAALREGRIVELANHTVLIARDGTERAIADTAAPIRDQGGDVIGVVLVFRDVTEKRKTQREIQRLAMIAEQASEGIATGALDGTLTFVNNAWVRMHGYDSPDELIGKHLSIFHTEEQVKTDVEPALTDIAEIGYRTAEVRHVRKDGSTFPTLMIVSLLRDDEGGPVALIGFAVDITERQRAEEALREAHERRAELERILDRSPVVVFLWRAAEGWPVEFVSETVRQFGYKPDDFYSGATPYSSIVHPDDIERVAEEVTRHSREGVAAYTQEYRILTASGETRWIDDRTWVRRDETGRITHYQGIVLDITDRKQAELALVKAKEAAEVAARTKSEFLANMSHEIRTPMNAIIGMTGLLLDTELTPLQREYAEVTRHSGDALLGVINDILDFSKIEAGRLAFESIPFDLRACVEEVGDLLAQKAHEKGIEFVIIVPPQAPLRLMGDPGRLRQIILNLASNAVKFTEKGEVVIRAAVDSLEDSRVTLRFTVTDTGVGIPPDRMDSLFDSFSQVDASTTRKHGGTGLGLAISSQLVGMMGGEIGVESEPGKGSTFWFTVTLDVAAQSAPDEPPPSASIRGLRVLVVDDNRANRIALRGMLQLWGCRCVEAADGFTALEEMSRRAGGPDAIQMALLDYTMPGMDGEELARKIKAEPATSGTPLLLLTSAPAKGDARRMEEVGFAAYLTKPVKRSHLFDAIASIVSRLEQAARPRTERPLITQHSVSEARRARTRVLVVEDNAINQKVTTRMLERLGFRCDVAANGREAVEALARIPYDLVLMDCQMPEMDGYEATRTIRRAEGDGPRTVIVAMTAEAFKGDRERCLAAGMDDYLAKPVELHQLQDMLIKYLGERRAAQAAPSPALDDSAPLDMARLREATGDDPELEREIIELFLEDQDRRLVLMRQELDKGDMDAMRILAHTLRGAAGCVGAVRLAAVAARLQLASESDRADQCAAMIEDVTQELQAAREALQDLLKDVARPPSAEAPDRPEM